MKKAVYLLLGALVAPAWAFDDARLAQHLRETLNLDTRTPIEVHGEPRPSKFGDLNQITVLVGGAPYEVFITKDEKSYFWGLTADLTMSPDEERAKTIDLKQAHAIGSANAPVTVVEYSDFACSFCKKAHSLLKEQLHNTYKPSQVRWVYKHYPLTTHPWAMPAAVAAECAGRQKPEAFWSMAEFFFENQNDITEENVGPKSRAEAARLGLKAGAFKSCLEDPKVRDRASAEKKEGASIGVQSTPTIFVNGRMRRGFREFDDIRVLIDEKLKEDGK